VKCSPWPTCLLLPRPPWLPEASTRAGGRKLREERRAMREWEYEWMVIGTERVWYI
jgi:hypothetical protein